MKQLLSTIMILNTMSLFALNLDDAVNEAVKNNYDLETQKHIYEQSRQNVKLNQSVFLPKVNLAYNYNNRDEIIGTQLKEDSALTAVISYNLFKGLSDFHTLNSAKFLEKSSRFTLEANIQDIILNTKKAYINYLNSKKNLSSYEDAFKLFDKQYLDTKIKFEQGILVKNDLLHVHVNLLRAKENVVNAKKDLKVSLLNLSNIMGGKFLESIDIEDLTLTTFDKNNYDETQLENRSELQALKMAISSYRSLEKATEGSFLPSVDASVSTNKYGDNFGLSSIDQYSDHQNIATLKISWNLYNGEKDTTQKIIYLTQQKELQSKLQKVKLDINLQYQKAILEFDVAKENFETSKLGLEQAKENYELVTNRFNAGLSTATDLIDANYLLTQAKQKYYQSYYDKFLVIATLDRVFEIK